MTLDVYHERLEEWEEQLKSLTLKVNEIEDYVKMEDRVTVSDVLIRLTKLEYAFDELKNKKPYKCPACDGKGYHHIYNGMLLPTIPAQFPKENCKACNGKGIVWYE